jgi:hypothetical protein
MLLHHAMRRVRPFAVSIKRLIARFLSRRNVQWPDLHQTAFLTTFPVADGDGIEAAAAAYFDNALSAAGFITAEDVPQLIADYMEQKRSWWQALLTEVEGQRRIGLSVYAQLAGPLEGGLDWSNIPAGQHNDRLYRIRPHRFGFMPRLAIAASCGADTLPAILATLDGWIALIDSRRMSDAYFSNLVTIYRILAISWTIPFCTALARTGNNTAAVICLRLFQILAADARHLWPRLGDSAENNHLLADRFAAWFMATCYPDLCPKVDRADLERMWEVELCRQFHPDGTNFEQSVHYHELGCELALAYLVISLRRGQQPSASIVARIRAMQRFQAALADSFGNSFSLGDATEDPLLPLNAGAGSAGGAWRIIYKTLFDPTLQETCGRAKGAERAFWLLATLSHIAKPIRTLEPPAAIDNFVAFPDGGYVVLREDHRQQLILFRTGPRHGLPVHFGHAMSDLLSVYWIQGGQPVMEPSGTFSYATLGGKEKGTMSYRNYFRSPAASNGVVMRGHDPLGMPTGRFRNHDNGTRATTRWRSLDNLVSWTEGRLDEEGPLNGHRRGILHLFGQYTLVYDQLPPLPPETDISCHWQLAPEVEASVIDGGLSSIRLVAATAFICVDNNHVVMSCAKGQVDPMAGWVSRSYGRIQAAPQLIANLTSPTRNLAFLFGLEPGDNETPAVEMRYMEQSGLLIEIRWGHHRGIVCIGNVSIRQALLPFDLDFRGDVLWLGTRNDTPYEIRALGLQALHSKALNLDLIPGASAGENWCLADYQTEDVGVSARWIMRP